MRTQLEFISSEFPAYPSEEENINPGRFGKRLAEYLQDALPQHGFRVRTICNEDWGYMVELENPEFPLWIGCGNLDDSENEFQCFIEPSTPYVRRWFSKIETTQVVEKLANALETTLSESGKVSNLKWQTEST